MVEAKSGEEAVRFIPLLKGSDAVGARAPRIGISVYQFALAGLDLITVLFAFWVAARITGLVWLIEGQPAQYVCLFAPLSCAHCILSLIPPLQLPLHFSPKGPPRLPVQGHVLEHSDPRHDLHPLHLSTTLSRTGSAPYGISRRDCSAAAQHVLLEIPHQFSESDGSKLYPRRDHGLPDPG